MKKKLHYCWLILISCCMLQGAGLGVVSNCAGLYYEPIAKELGFSIGSISLYSSISIIASCLVMLVATKLLEKYPARIVLTMGAICTSAPQLFMSFCNDLWQWYVLAIIQGAGLAFTMNLVAPIILNNWFQEKIGFALGLSASAGGIVGAIMSTLLGSIIHGYGWRTAYRVAGCIGLVITVPVCLFVLYMHPKDKGMLPYGKQIAAPSVRTADEQKISYARLFRDSHLWKIIPIIAMGRVSTAFMTHITTYGNSIGFAIMDASVLTTLFMVGNMISKIGFGPLNDRYGAEKCSYLGLAIIFVSEVLLITAIDVPVMVGSLLFGTVSMFSQVQVVILCRNSWKGAAYAQAMVIVQVISQIFYSAGISGLGFAYDFMGDYRPLILMLIVSVFMAGVFVYLIFHKKKISKSV